MHPLAADMCVLRTIARSVWGTGQDQMRVVKQRLLEMLPDACVFLDADGTHPPSTSPHAMDPLARSTQT